MVEKYKILAVEGNCRSGKSTLMRNLGRQYGYPTIGEYGPYFNGADNLPSFPPETYSEAKSSVDTLIRIETRRSAEALELNASSQRPVITDRSPLSLVVFQQYVRDAMPDVPNAYNHTLDVLGDKIAEEDIVIPNAIIYLRPSLETFKARVLKHGRVKIDFHNEEDTWLYNDDWYRNLIQNIYNDGDGTELESSEGSQVTNMNQAHDFTTRARFIKDSITIFQGLIEGT